MGRIVAVEYLSLDGVFEDPAWTQPYFDDAVGAFQGAAMQWADALLMGRVTYEGIGHPLPYRTNIVVTRRPAWSSDGVLVAGSVKEAIDRAAELDGDIVIGGGTQIYEQAMPYATHQVLTEVHRSPEGDTCYPSYDRDEWTETRREDRDGFSWVWLERAKAGEHRVR